MSSPVRDDGPGYARELARHAETAARLASEIRRGPGSTADSCTRYAEYSARSLDESARHFHAGRVPDGIRELAAAERRIRLYIATRRDEARSGPLDRIRRQTALLEAARPVAERVGGLASSAAAQWPQPLPSWPRTVRVIYDNASCQAQWHVIQSPQSWKELAACADINGADIRDQPLPEFLAAGADDSHLVAYAADHGWDVQYTPVISAEGILGSRVFAAHPYSTADNSSAGASFLDGACQEPGTAAAVLETISGLPGTVRHSPLAPPGMCESLSARALLYASYAKKTAKDHSLEDARSGNLVKAVTGRLLSAAGHLDDGSPAAALPDVSEACQMSSRATTALEAPVPAGPADPRAVERIRRVNALSLGLAKSVGAAFAAEEAAAGRTPAARRPARRPAARPGNPGPGR